MSMEDEWDAQLERDEFYDEKESIMSKLDDILAFADGINAYDEKQLAKQEIKDLMLELIGEDENTGHSALEVTLNLHPLYHNELRTELRQKVKSL